MKLDKDCVRELLLTVEEEFDILHIYYLRHIQVMPRMKQYDPKLVFYTMDVLSKGGFLDYLVGKMTHPETFYIKGMTYAGHQLLDDIRDASVWSEVKEKVGEKVGSASISVLAAFAQDYVKKKLGI